PTTATPRHRLKRKLPQPDLTLQPVVPAPPVSIVPEPLRSIKPAERSDVHRGNRFGSLTTSDGKHPLAVRNRNAPIGFRDVQASTARRAKRLIAQPRITNCRLNNCNQKIASRLISMQPFVWK